MTLDIRLSWVHLRGKQPLPPPPCAQLQSTRSQPHQPSSGAPSTGGGGGGAGGGENAKVQLRREKNRLAARKCRAKK